jgi:DNA-binding NtrC family response regulator
MNGAVLLIDKDLGHSFWLSRALDNARFQTFPARSIPNGETLLRELHLSVDVLVFDCALPGAREFIEKVHRHSRPLRVICLNGERHHRCVPGVHGICPKAVEFSERSRMKWVREFREVLYDCEHDSYGVHP